MNGHPLENPFTSAFRTSTLVLTGIVLAFSLVFLPTLMVLATVLGIVLLLLVFHRPVSALGIVLAYMPIHFLVVILGQFFGLPHMTLVSACTKEVVLLLLILILWQRNGFKPTTPDWFLLGCLTLALLRTAVGGKLIGLRDDFSLLIPYVAGRVTVITSAQERLWAKCAVWIAAVLSVAGMVEVFYLGPGPRKVIFTAFSGDTDLGDSFRASGFEGIRAASTMVSPLDFGALCMVGVIIWWVYVRNPLPVAFVCGGLLCSLTRSAWVGTALAIPILALRLGQSKRVMRYALLALAAFVLAIPILDIGDYLSSTRSGQDISAESHSASLVQGLEYVGTNPFGSGAGSVGPRAVQENYTGFNIESTYLTLAANYGVLAGGCFLAFFVSALRRTWNNRTQLGYLATAILMGIGAMMMFLPIHVDLRLDCWVWFPVGLSIRANPV